MPAGWSRATSCASTASPSARSTKSGCRPATNGRVVRIDITLGPDAGTAFQEGDTIPSQETAGAGALTDVLGEGLATQVDSLLLGTTATLDAARMLMAGSQDELQQTLVAVQSSAVAVTTLLRAEQNQLSRAIDGAITLTDNLNGFTGENGDSLRVITRGLGESLDRLNQTLTSLESTMAALDRIIGKIEQGEGTLGLLVNDPSLYHQFDSTLTTLNRILLDFERNPKRYLKDLKLVDVF
jgi:phospholipid/cholesterol/gamma-HCH transport system substrate-binding protein